MSHACCRHCGTSWDTGESWEKDRTPDCPRCNRYPVKSRSDAEAALDEVCEWITDQGELDYIAKLDLYNAVKKIMTTALDRAIKEARTNG